MQVFERGHQLLNFWLKILIFFVETEIDVCFLVKTTVVFKFLLHSARIIEFTIRYIMYTAPVGTASLFLYNDDNKRVGVHATLL